MNVALGIAAGRVGGARVNLDSLVPAGGNTDALVRSVNKTLLNGGASENTLRTMRDQTRDLTGDAARTMAIGLALGSPEFQRQ